MKINDLLGVNSVYFLILKNYSRENDVPNPNLFFGVGIFE